MLRKAMQDQQVSRYSKPFDEMSRIGIFFDATELSPREAVLEYAADLKKQGKKIRLLGFFDSKLENPNYTFPHFNRKNLDWAFRPKKKEVDQFLEKDFDLLLIAFPQSTFVSEYIGALTQAHLRVGPVTEHTYAYDLMIDGGPEMDLTDFFRQAETVLKLNNRQHEKERV
jgi:hypothetical protein